MLKCSKCDAESVSRGLCRRHYSSEYRSANLEKCREYSRTYSAKKAYRLRRYGLSVSEFDAMLGAQNGVCAICGGAPHDRYQKNMAVDHCHETGRIRGILCLNCNSALGLFAEDANRLRAAIEYLSRNE